MGFANLEKYEVDVEKVVPVAGDEDPVLRGREAKLLLVSNLSSIDLMDGEYVEPKPSGDFGSTRIDIFVQEKPHWPGSLVPRP